MASRQFYYAESTAESSDASGAYVDKVTLTFTPMLLLPITLLPRGSCSN
jgi:hypothetical protein